MAPASLSGDPNNQIWLWTALFALVGFVGIVLFLIYFVLVIVQYGADRKAIADDEVQLAPIRGGGGDRSWFWIWQILGIAFSIFVAWSLSMLQVNSFHNGFFRQATPFFYGMWGLLYGIFNFIVFTAWYRTRGRKRNFDLRQTGVLTPRRAVWRTTQIGLLSILALAGFIFTVDYIFHTKYTMAVELLLLPGRQDSWHAQGPPLSPGLLRGQLPGGQLLQLQHDTGQEQDGQHH